MAMKLRQCRRSGFGWITSTVLVSIVLMLHWLCTFQTIDQRIYDQIDRLMPDSRHQHHVLLVYLSNDHQTVHQQLIPLIDRIALHEPKKIGVVSATLFHDPDQIRNHRSSDKIVVGRRVSDYPSGGSADFDPLAGIKMGFSDLHLSGQSLYRTANAVFNRDDKVLFSLEAELVCEFPSASESIPEQEFGINFVSGNNSIPNITADEILAGNIVSELIEDKIILIGMSQDPTFGLITPINSGNHRMSRLEVRGNIAQTLLRGDFTLPAGPLAVFFLVSLLVFLTSPFARQLHGRWLLLAGVTSIAFCVLLGIGSWIWLGRTLPISSLILAVCLSFVTTIYQRFEVLKSGTEYWRLATGAGMPQTNTQNDNHVWQLLSDSVYQMFYPSRLVLLELDPNTTHLKIVTTTNCNEKDIFEKRRDVQRSPYKEVIEQRRSAKVERRRFFIPKHNSEEVEFIVPLLSNGRTLGIMALCMEEIQLERWRDFPNFLDRLGEAGSLLISENRSFRNKELSRQSMYHRLKCLPEQRALRKIELQNEYTISVAKEVEHAFENSESALAICDSFGHITKRNSKLISFLQEAQIEISHSSCVEIMSLLSGRPQSDCRRIFRNVVIENRIENIYIHPTRLRPTPCQMHLKPRRRISEYATNDSGLNGVLLEIIDGTPFNFANHWLAQITESHFNSIKRGLASLRRGIETFDGKTRIGTNKTETIKRGLKDISDLCENWRTINQGRISECPREFLPVDTRLVWNLTFEEFTQRLESRNIDVASHYSTEECLGVANPFLLVRIFRMIMEITLENAFDHSEIFVGIESSGRNVHFNLNSRSEETPIQGLRDSLAARPELPDTQTDVDSNALGVLNENQLDRINEVKTWLEAWNGTLQIQKSNRLGTSIELTLPTDVDGRPTKALAQKTHHSRSRI